MVKFKYLDFCSGIGLYNKNNFNTLLKLIDSSVLDKLVFNLKNNIMIELIHKVINKNTESITNEYLYFLIQLYDLHELQQIKISYKINMIENVIIDRSEYNSDVKLYYVKINSKSFFIIVPNINNQLVIIEQFQPIISINTLEQNNNINCQWIFPTQYDMDQHHEYNLIQKNTQLNYEKQQYQLYGLLQHIKLNKYMINTINLNRIDLNLMNFGIDCLLYEINNPPYHIFPINKQLNEVSNILQIYNSYNYYNIPYNKIFYYNIYNNEINDYKLFYIFINTISLTNYNEIIDISFTNKEMLCFDKIFLIKVNNSGDIIIGTIK